MFNSNLNSEICFKLLELKKANHLRQEIDYARDKLILKFQFDDNHVETYGIAYIHLIEIDKLVFENMPFLTAKFIEGRMEKINV